MTARAIEAVVIGASAGGVEALNSIFSALPRPLPVPVLVTLHVAPQGSIIVSAFGAKAPPMRMKEAEDKEALQPETVYFAPPNYHLLVEADHTLSLSVDELVHFARPSIDVLFESASEAFGDKLLGILLTGANEDGAEGLHRIHEGGGITIVQDPETAQSSTMPAAGLKIFRPTFVYGLEEIARALAELTGAAAGAPEGVR